MAGPPARACFTWPDPRDPGRPRSPWAPAQSDPGRRDSRSRREDRGPAEGPGPAPAAPASWARGDAAALRSARGLGLGLGCAACPGRGSARPAVNSLEPGLRAGHAPSGSSDSDGRPKPPGSLTPVFSGGRGTRGWREPPAASLPCPDPASLHPESPDLHLRGSPALRRSPPPRPDPAPLKAAAPRSPLSFRGTFPWGDTATSVCARSPSALHPLLFVSLSLREASQSDSAGPWDPSSQGDSSPRSRPARGGVTPAAGCAPRRVDASQVCPLRPEEEVHRPRQRLVPSECARPGSGRGFRSPPTFPALPPPTPPLKVVAKQPIIARVA
ncbi:basic salivary proline-rich protein 1-like [Peromyscus eremicus]|uniref:basic salivary proline-rich protein 1-like n=1 Tax=Peromyscus eremicus TaxID=42410 RepID=UPI0027DBBD2A|nr:basic salivary proline-rich protein 1-like [Peromyscus eremicus]